MDGPGGPIKFFVNPGALLCLVLVPFPGNSVSPGAPTVKVEGPGGTLVDVLGGPGGPTNNKFW